MNDERHDVSVASGAYVLHALDHDEAARFEELLAASEDLRTEVTELADTAVELGLALSAVQPSEVLRARILREIERVPDAVPRRTAHRVVVTRRHRARTRIALALSAVAAAAGLVVVGVQVVGAPPDRVAAIRTASDVRTSDVEVSGGGSLLIRWSHALGESSATARDLPAPASGRTYQLWYIDGETARSAGTFDGSGTIALDGRLHDGDTIGMTIEPAGGSAAPSSVPIAALAT